MGNPAWMICKYAMIMLQYIFGKRFYYFSKRFCKALLLFFSDTCVTFQNAFTKRLYYFSKHYSALALISRCVSTQFLDHISSLFLDCF
jgi:hypothetical protein